MKIGTYYEDGWLAEVKIVEDKSNDDEDRYVLEVIKTIKTSPIFKSVPDGHVFEVSQSKKHGFWPGMWHLHNIVEDPDGETS